MPTRKSTRRRTTTRRRKAAAPARRPLMKSSGWQLGTQMLIAISAMAALALLGFVDRNMFSAALGRAEPTTTVSIDVGLEHEGPADLTMLIARKGPLGYTEIKNTSDKPLKISLPEKWERTEVSGGNMWLVEQSDPEFGFVKWTIPAKMGMSLRAPQVPDEIVFHSPSGQTASVRITSVDLEDSARNERTLLFQNVAQAKIWQADE
jgi:hypothetical protein